MKKKNLFLMHFKLLQENRFLRVRFHDPPVLLCHRLRKLGSSLPGKQKSVVHLPQVSMTFNSLFTLFANIQ